MIMPETRHTRWNMAEFDSSQDRTVHSAHLEGKSPLSLLPKTHSCIARISLEEKTFLGHAPLPRFWANRSSADQPTPKGGNLGAILTRISASSSMLK
jgi:hypothetical protein